LISTIKIILSNKNYVTQKKTIFMPLKIIRFTISNDDLATKEEGVITSTEIIDASLF
jgi:hypothetical protein